MAKYEVIIIKLDERDNSWVDFLSDSIEASSVVEEDGSLSETHTEIVAGWQFDG